MSKELDAMHESLRKAQRQVDILCHGFNVRIEPVWGDVVNSIVLSIGEWERTGKLPCKKIGSPCVYYAPWSIHSSFTKVVAEELPPILFNQFKEKFLAIIKEFVLPALKEYRKAHSNMNMEIFKPLLIVKLK